MFAWTLKFFISLAYMSVSGARSRTVARIDTFNNYALQWSCTLQSLSW